MHVAQWEHRSVAAAAEFCYRLAYYREQVSYKYYRCRNSVMRSAYL